MTRLLTADLNRRRVLHGLAAAFALPLAACARQYHWNQKLTVVVATPQGDASGSAVTHIAIETGRILLSGNGMSLGMVGEATVVEVAPGRYLFALLDFNTTFQLAMETWKDVLPHKTNEELWAQIEKLRQTRDLAAKSIPLLATFTDITRPQSVQKVDPANLAATFGEGYALKSVTLEITDEPVTEGKVEKVLGWLHDPIVMRNPGWKTLPVEARRLIEGLLSQFHYAVSEWPYPRISFSVCSRWTHTTESMAQVCVSKPTMLEWHWCTITAMPE